MTIGEIVEKLELKPVCQALDLKREVRSGYTGDLLSRVMGKAAPDSAWITIMSGVNVAAAAVFADVSLVIFAEGVLPDEELLAKAQEQGVALYVSCWSAFKLAGKLFCLFSEKSEIV